MTQDKAFPTLFMAVSAFATAVILSMGYVGTTDAIETEYSQSQEAMCTTDQECHDMFGYRGDY